LSSHLRFLAFSRRNLAAAIAGFTGRVGGTRSRVRASEQFGYLVNYLKELRCRSFVVEGKYVDADYMDEHAAFYARCHRAYPNHCIRVHFFSAPCSRTRILHALGGLQARPQRTRGHASLQRDYLGFSVVRPNPTAFIGRTVLPGLKGKRRHYTCRRKYEVSFAGLALSVEGLAFQQQDATTSACATTAIWVALQKTAHDERFRIPTCSEITVNATRFSLEHGRSIPNSGLSQAQMCEAVRASGLEPDLFDVSREQQHSRHLAYSYLSSGFPVIACIYIYDMERAEYDAMATAFVAAKEDERKRPEPDWDSGHAITLVGYRGAPSRNQSVLLAPEPGQKKIRVLMVGEQVTEFYCHDDRLGPYARVKCIEPPWGTSDISIEWPGSQDPELARIEYLLVPVYPKVRLDYQDVQRESLKLLRFLELRGLPPLQDLALDFSVVRGRKYCEGLVTSEPAIPNRELYEILTHESMPRYLAVCSVGFFGVPLMDILFDTTESRLGDPLIGLVYRHPWARTYARQLDSVVGRYKAVAPRS
jgi:hypothetical protein